MNRIYKTTVQFIVLSLLTYIPLQAQVYDGSVSLFSQSAVDDFPSNYSNTNKVTGNFTIRSNSTTDPITNLDSLYGMEYIGGTLDMRFNDSLHSVAGFNSLDTVGVSIFLSRNPVLPNVDGFNNLKYIGRNLEMSYNDILENLDGFSGLNRVEESIQIGRMDNLQHIDGFQSLTSVGTDLILTFLPNMANVDGLANLNDVGNDFLIGLVDSIENVDALINLTGFSGTFHILMNANITNLDGFANVQTAERVRIDRNESLTECCGIFELLNTPGAVLGSISVVDNDTGCESTADIIACDGDGDGFQQSKDCDDNNPTIYPGAPELCDGLDNNCNDTADEDILCYCESSGLNTQYEWIQSVTLEEINNLSNNDNGYGDYTEQIADLATGENYLINLEPGFSDDPYWEYWTVWIDLNQDGVFEENTEEVFSKVSYKEITGQLQIPSTAELGETRMRIAMSYSGFASSCDSIAEGEVEDYKITISSCDNVTEGGIIGDDELLCAGDTIADEISNISPASGGSGDLVYIWMKNTATDTPPTIFNDNGWVVIEGAMDVSYDPGALTETTWFLRCARRAGCKQFVGKSNVIQKRVQESCDPYCESSSESTNYEWIKQMKMGDINNNSGNDNGYGDYKTMSTSVLPGEDYKIRLKPGFSSGSYYEYWSVWVDWNQDGDFDDNNELTVQAIHYNQVTRYINVPADALPGTTRMRVAMKYGGYPDACESFGEGEVEDYSIIVEANTSGLIATGGNGNQEEDAVGRDGEETELVIDANSLNLYPNPTTDDLYMRLANFVSGTATVSIYNQLGQKVTQKIITSNLDGQVHFDVSEYGEGMYVLTVELENQELVSKSFMIVR